MLQSSSSGRVPTIWAAVAAAVLGFVFGSTREWNKNRLRRKGIARVVADDLRRAQSAITRMWMRGAIHPQLLADKRFGEDEQRRLATTLKPNEWATVSSAIGWLDRLERIEADTPLSPRHEARGERIGYDDLVELYERLDSARWALRRASAPVPARIPILGLTRLRWRKHGVGGIARNEAALYAKSVQRTPDRPCLPGFASVSDVQQLVDAPEGAQLAEMRRQLQEVFADLSVAQLQLRRWRGVSEARAYEARWNKTLGPPSDREGCAKPRHRTVDRPPHALSEPATPGRLQNLFERVHQWWQGGIGAECTRCTRRRERVRRWFGRRLAL